MFSLLAPDALQKYYTEFLPLKCHQHKHSDFLKYTLRLANFHAASEFQFSKFPSIISLTHPFMESRKGKSMFVGIETQKNNPIGRLFIMLKTSGCTYFIFFIYLRMQILSKHINLSSELKNQNHWVTTYWLTAKSLALNRIRMCTYKWMDVLDF